ncbi:MAG: SUMF1/EgtB/PvdO family nonheme iron enzyme [Armatimonadetes bacterium]|nr:SUMF1/EgtB/PvdO family nonheme iron enzyme [Armatimonadota bacterium]
MRKHQWTGLLLAYIGLLALSAASGSIGSGEAGATTGEKVPSGFSALGDDLDPVSKLPMRIRHDKSGCEFVLVPAGEFIMGSPKGEGDSDEHPKKTILLGAYWIGLTEVTNKQYRAFRPNHDSDESKFSYPDMGDYSFNGDYQPVVEVSWDDAVTFCKWAGMRLPTEREWEKAARGTDGRIYPWGNSWDSRLANSSDKNNPRATDRTDKEADDGFGITSPVGSYPSGASPYGCLDMAGNVWEWSADWWDRNPYNTTEKKPWEMASGWARVVRGGSWMDSPSEHRATNPWGLTMDYADWKVGFRVVVSPLSD